MNIPKENMMNMRSIKTVALVCIGSLLFLVTACGSDVFTAKQTKTFDGTQVQEIVVRTEGQNVELRPSQNEEIKVSMDADAEIPAVISGDILTIDLGSSSSLINFKTNKLLVELPSQSYRKLNLTTSSGEIKGEDLQAEQLQLSSDSGLIEINGFEGSQITAEVVASNINLNNVGGDLILNNDTGNINVLHKGELRKETQINTGTGSVDFSFENKPDMLTLNVSTESGSITSSLTSSNEVVSKGAGQQISTTLGANGEAPLLFIRSNSGSINIK